MLKRIKGYVLDIYELIRKPYMSTLPGNLAFFFCFIFDSSYYDYLTNIINI